MRIESEVMSLVTQTNVNTIARLLSGLTKTSVESYLEDARLMDLDISNLKFPWTLAA